MGWGVEAFTSPRFQDGSMKDVGHFLSSRMKNWGLRDVPCSFSWSPVYLLVLFALTAHLQHGVGFDFYCNSPRSLQPSI